MSAPGKLVRSSRWKTGPSKGQRPLGSECCVTPGDSGHEAYTAIAWGVGLSLERSDIAGAEGFHSLEGNMCGTAMRGADGMVAVAFFAAAASDTPARPATPLEARSARPRETADDQSFPRRTGTRSRHSGRRRSPV